MKRLIIFLSALMLVLPVGAQNLKQTFTGTIEALKNIPQYAEGKTFSVNPYAGGQSGSMVVVKLGEDS